MGKAVDWLERVRNFSLLFSRKTPIALSSNFAQQMKTDADIVRIIGEHLRLRKSRWWKGDYSVS